MKQPFRWMKKLQRKLQPVATLPPGFTKAPTSHEQRVQQTVDWSKPQPAAPWTQDVRRHNEGMSQAEKAKRFARFTAYLRDASTWPPRMGVLFDRYHLPESYDILEDLFRPDNSYVAILLALTEVVDYYAWREARTADVTHEAPKLALLTKEETTDAREAGTLGRQVTEAERQRIYGSTGAPTDEEILYAAGGDEVKAAQLKAKVRELFGEPFVRVEHQHIAYGYDLLLQRHLCACGYWQDASGVNLKTWFPPKENVPDPEVDHATVQESRQ